jgi:hypothetical protein
MKWIAACLLVVIFAACSDSDKIPKGIIGKEKMEKVMWDMLMADRYVNLYINNSKDSTTDKKKDAAVVYERVFQMHGITRDEFIKSYKFYLSRPDITKVLFDSISAQAEKRRAEAHAPKRYNPILQKRDSLRRVESIRKADSIEKLEFKESTEGLSDSEMRRRMFPTK